MRSLKIVHFLDYDWEEDQRRPHVEALSKYCNILCVEPPLTIDLLFRKPKYFCINLPKLIHQRQINNKLFVYKPMMLFSAASSLLVPWINRLNLVVIKLFLSSVIKKLNMCGGILTIRHPAWSFVIGWMYQRFLCYEVSDEWSELPSAHHIFKRKIRDIERRVLEKADIIFCSAKRLTDTKKAINPNTFFIPNSADTKFFESSLDPEIFIPQELENIHHPRIGLIGNINDHVDIELISFLAESNPEWSIILIGKVNGSRKFLHCKAYLKTRKLNNVYYLGWKNYDSLPAYQKGLDICMLPYVVNEYTKNVYPNKVYQYLAGGKPVVSTYLPELKPLQDIIFISRTQHEYLVHIKNVLAQDKTNFIKRRLAVARENSIEKNAQLRFNYLQKEFLLKLNSA